jgi:hypothetical protein
MCKKLIYPIFLFNLVLGLSTVQAQDLQWDRALYWDDDYASAWAGADTSIRDALEAAGYTVLDAAQLKTWMDGHIADRALSVVVFCKDVVPDTVAESMNADCTIRKYLDAGGKVIWYSDWPFYYQGSSDGTNETWGSAGATSVLGFNASSGPNDTMDEVVFTEAGIEWGLTTTWQSQRPTSVTATDNLTPLALISSGSAAAWAKHFVPGDTYRGFVRLYDTGGVPPSVEDVMRVAEYIATSAASPSPADGAVIRSTWTNLTWAPGASAISHNVYLGENYDEVAEGTGDTFQGNQTSTDLTIGFAGFPYPDGLISGTTYYWRIDEVDSTNTYTGDVWSFTIAPKNAFDPNPNNGADSVDQDVELSWEPGFGAILHYVVFGENFDDVNNTAMGTPVGQSKYKPGTLELAKTYYWRVDAFEGIATHRGDIWSFNTVGGVGGPNPTNGAVDVKPSVVIKWNAGAVAASHEMYFGTDMDAVRNATKTSSEYKGPIALGDENYTPGQLDLATTYYWRIDEVNSVNPDSPWTGIVWSFTTSDYFVIDDFEDYNANENQIWWAWKDGLGYVAHDNEPAYAGNGTGSAVGDETTTSFTEETIVHSGNQSMPLFYDNNKQGYAKYSETELSLTNQRDWTAEGVIELSLWFHGDSNNSAEPLYIAVSNNTGTPAIVTHDEPAAANINTWTEWVIPLQAFTDQGINLTNVDKIAIGMGTRGNTTTAGGSGKMLFDDIRLYKP